MLIDIYYFTAREVVLPSYDHDSYSFNFAIYFIFPAKFEFSSCQKENFSEIFHFFVEIFSLLSCAVATVVEHGHLNFENVRKFTVFAKKNFN
jgi:hypothetical protein